MNYALIVTVAVLLVVLAGAISVGTTYSGVTGAVVAVGLVALLLGAFFATMRS